MILFGRRDKEVVERVPLPTVMPLLLTANVGAAYGAARTGGDFFEFLQIPGNVLLMAMFDIAGKRAQALELAADVQRTMREKAEPLLNEHGNVNDALSAMAMELNRLIIRKEGVHNSPAFLAAFEEETNILAYVNAGHTPGLLRDEDGIEELAAAGVPLGLFSHVVHEPKMTVLREGAVLLIPSRGIVEAKAGSKEFGLEGVREIVAQNGFASADELAERVVRAAERHSATPSFWGPRLAIPGFADADQNDMTAVALMRPAAGAVLSAYAA